jgi:hypothetical protein
MQCHNSNADPVNHHVIVRVVDGASVVVRPSDALYLH